MRTIQAFLNAEPTVMPIGERAMEALKVSLLGMGAVFAVLAIIWIILSLFRVIFARQKTAPKQPKVKNVEVKAPVPAKAAQSAAVPASAPSVDYSVIAAISAAVAAVLESECAANGTVYNGFRVVSVRRSDKGRSWTQKN